jgi:hypothetical protein
MKRMFRRIRAFIGASASAAACASGSDELAPPAAADTSCHILPEAVNARFPEVARTFALELHATDRTLTIGVDSQNRVRVFTSGVHIKRGTNLTVRLAGARFDTAGAMTMASRSITAGEIESKAVSTSTIPLVPAETARVRSLAIEAQRRCIG